MKDEPPRDLRERTKRLALMVVHLVRLLPRTLEGSVFGRQILRSGTSPGAHYREACRAKSDADMISKLEGALQELDETLYWAELIRDAGLLTAEQVAPVLGEADELTAILVSSVLRVKARGHP